MAELNELDNLDFFDDDYSTQAEEQLNQQEETQEDNEEQEEDNNEEVDLLTEFLQSKGINPQSVKMENDYGETEEYNFNDLSREEQMQLLNYNPTSKEVDTSNLDLSPDEEQLLGILRQNNMSVKDYLNAYGRHVIERYVANQPEPEVDYEIDDFSDEELFIADLKDKVPDLTEEEALQELELQRQNPELFKKKVDGLRANYKEREDQMRELEAKQTQAQQAQQAAQFEQIIVDTIQNNDSIDLGDTALELSEDDMNEIASFILDTDSAGVRYIAKALNDPKTLVEMAWWTLKGHDALNQITQYYKKQIAEARREARASAPRQKPVNVVSKPKKKSNNPNNETDLFDNLI